MDISATVRAKWEQKCAECGGQEFVEDQSAGDLICTSCGVVLESHAIDERSEWRTFSDKDKESADPNRVGGPSNPLLNDGGLGTMIAAGKNDGGMAHNLNRLLAQRGGADTDQKLQNAFRDISKMCDRLGLVKAITSRSQELYKKAFDAKAIKVRGTSAVYAAVVYIACRQEGMARTFKEICAATPEPSDVKTVGRMFKLLRRELKLSEGVGVTNTRALMRRFGSALGMQVKELIALERMAEVACPEDGVRPNGQRRPWDGKNPASIAGALLMMMSSLPKCSVHPDVSEIAESCGIAVVTIRGTYKDMVQHASELLPKGYNAPEDIEALPAL